MPQIALPVGSYALPDPSASCRRLINCFSEATPQSSNADSKQLVPPALLRRMPGITPFANDGTGNPVRGIWEMAGTVYVVIGPTLYTLSATGTLTQLGTGIAGGTNFVRMSDNTACLVILVPGTATAYTYTQSGGLAALTAGTFTQFGALDLGFIDSYIVFLARNGLEFYNDDGKAVSGTGPITLNNGSEFPREFGTDPFVGMEIDHRQICMLGTRTSELYVDAGNATNSPFSSAPDNFMEIGCDPAAGYTVVKQDQSAFWIANDRTVRRRNGQTPQRVSDSGIESILQSADLTGSYGLAYTVAGHLMVAFTLPAEGRTLVYDCGTTAWHELESFGLGYWRAQCVYNAFGKQLVGDSQSGQIGYLDPTVQTEFGDDQTVSFTTQSVYSANNRLSHRRIELMLGGGFAALGLNPQITLFASDDGGSTFRALPTKSLGLRGEYANRVFWLNCGTSRRRAYRFQVSDAVPTFAVDIQAVLEPGRF